MRDILDKKDQFFEIQSEIDALEHLNGGMADEDARSFRRITKLREQIQWLSEAISYHITEIETVGCLMKDFSNGLIDFPALQNGREVYFCWKFGEDRVSHWHEVDSGFDDRKNIDQSFTVQ